MTRSLAAQPPALDAPLPDDPALVAPPAVESALATLTRALRGGAASAALPTFDGVPAPVLARWLYRRWRMENPASGPFAHVDPTLGGALTDVAAAALDGWLLLAPCDAPPALPGPALVLYAPRAVALPAPPEWARRLRALDALHAVAVDPALRSARATLAAHARANGAVLLHGPSLDDAAALARLAHASVADAPPLRGLADPVGAAWLLVEEVDRLGDDDAATLRHILTERTRPPTLVDHRGPARRPEHPALAPIIGESPALVAALEDTLRFAGSEAPTLILGEPGTGKELFARALHDASGRAGPFEAVDLGAIPRDLLEAELFGVVRGAFTGAHADRPGVLRRASGGTVLLDEVGNLDLASQAKLLRVLQERAVRPVGSERAIPVDVRVVAATNADLHAMVRRGAFRLDLLQRLDALTLRLPALRDRAGDVLRLARRALERSRGGALPSPWITPEAAARLDAWRWPGNVRELSGVMADVAVRAPPDQALDVAHLARLATPGVGSPVILTARSPQSIPALDARTFARAVAVHVAVPDLVDRGVASLRLRVLAGLDGRALTAEALRRLCAHGWDSSAALDAALAALRGLPTIDEPTVAALLGEDSGDAGAIWVVLDPMGAAWGRGFDAPAVVVGRARSWSDLRGRGDAESAARLGALRALAGESAAFLALADRPSLSRAQLVVRRGGAGLDAVTAPGAAMTARVREGAAITAGEPLPLGEGAVLQVVQEGAVLVEVGAFVSEAAFLRWRGGRPAGVTDAETLRDPSGGDRVWSLSDAEREALVRVVADFAGDDFSAHLRASLDPGAAATARLASYVLRTRPAQYCARLLAYAGNASTRQALAARVAADASLASRLPGQVLAALAAP